MSSRQQFSIEEKKGKGYLGIIPHKKTLKLVNISKKYYIGIPRPWYRKWDHPTTVAVLYSIDKGSRVIEIYKHYEEFDEDHHVQIDRTHSNVKQSTNYVSLDIDFLNKCKVTEEYQDNVRLQLNLNNDMISIKVPIFDVEYTETKKTTTKRNSKKGTFRRIRF